MAFMDKLKFWKRDEEIPFSPDLGEKPGLPGEHALPGEHGLPGEPSIGGITPEGTEVKPIEQSHIPGLEQPSFQRPEVRVEEVKTGFGESPDIYRISKEIEVLSSKIDAIKAGIDSITQRLAHIEKGFDKERERRW